MTTAEAYIAGWHACMAGLDGRYSNPHEDRDLNYAWNYGFLNAMDAEDGEDPDPECVGYPLERAKDALS